MTQEEFLEAALRIYPDLRPEVEDLEDLLHLQMDRFRNRLERDFRSRDELNVKAAMELAASCHRQGSGLMKDAIYPSFAEAVFAGHAKVDIKWAGASTPALIRSLCQLLGQGANLTRSSRQGRATRGPVGNVNFEP